MKMKQVMSMLMFLLLLVPGFAQASEHAMPMDHSKMKMDQDKKRMDHNKMAMEHGKNEMAGMMMLASEEADGVKAMFHLNDVKMQMAKAGQPFTHHLMVNFVDSKTGKPIVEGKVAVKVKTPAGVEGKAQMMMGMDGHFGIDLVLDQTGTYHFKIASKLADGKKREFNPQHQF
ncbi:MAG: hypothetical protein IBX47_05250 [Desulfuromonadales bacterium]|nr:hypothetical protein [Desulfuromonadales bacterium]